MSSDNNQFASQDEQRTVIELFKKACRKNDANKLGVAIDALAAISGRIRLSGYYPGTKNQMGDSLADRLVSMSQTPSLALNLAHQLHKLELPESANQRILAEILAVGLVHHDDEALAAVTKLIPTEISNDRLAFNLACHYALKRDRAAMFTYVKRALALGKTSEQFRTDSDFAAYIEDQEFIAILDADDAETELLTDLIQSIDGGDWAQFKPRIEATQQRGLCLSPQKILVRAIRGGNERIFSYLYESIAKQPKSYERTDEFELLLKAIEHRRHTMARLLLRRANIARMDNHYAALQMAIERDDAETVKMLLRGNLDFNQRTTLDLRTYLRKKYYRRDTIETDISRGFGDALQADAVDVIQLMMRRASRIHPLERKMYIKTLQYYLYRGNRPSRRMIAVLLQAGLRFADLRSHGEGESLLTKAILDQDTDFIDYLLDEMNAPLSRDLQEMRLAVRRGDARLLERLALHQRKLHPRWVFADAAFWKKFEALSNKRDSNRGALLRGLLYYSELDTIKAFATSVVGAEDKAARDTLLALAVAYDNTQAARYFLEQGADPNVLLRRDDKRIPAIAVALANCNYEIAEILLNHGAHTHSVDSRGDTLLHAVAFCEAAPGKLALIDRLAVAGNIDINAKNARGLTALAYATIKDDASGVRTLIRHGADAGSLRNHAPRGRS